MPPGAVKRGPPPPEPLAVVPDTVPEEDLLTSARTHFRPIRQETAAAAVTTTSSHAYADGTTFAIRGSVERVPYRRTDSGTLYLQREAGESPRRYLEWRGAEADAVEGHFIPRFRVRQNEKYCQTDGGEEEEVGSWCGGGEETPPPKKRVLSESRGGCCDCECDCDLYFPGECEHWRGGVVNTGDVWGAACATCAPAAPQEAVHLRRLRDELSREGDQLLSDLQRIVLPGAADPAPVPPPPVSTAPTAAEQRKRRHSGAPAAGALRLGPLPPPWSHLLLLQRHHRQQQQQIAAALRPVTL